MKEKEKNKYENGNKMKKGQTEKKGGEGNDNMCYGQRKRSLRLPAKVGKEKRCMMI